MSSCNIIAIDGMPIPCCESQAQTCHTKVKHKLDGRRKQVMLRRVCTYTDRENRADFVHGVTICPSADVGIPRFGVFHCELSCNKLSE